MKKRLSDLIVAMFILLIASPVFAQEVPPDMYNLRGSFTPIPITGNPFFDYFFTLLTLGGMVAFAISVLVKILSRS